MTPQALSALKEQREQLWSTIDAVLEENAKLRGEVDSLRSAPVALMVPGMDDNAELLPILEEAGKDLDCGRIALNAWIVKHANPTPSSRLLKDGEVAVRADNLFRLRAFVSMCKNSFGHDPYAHEYGTTCRVCAAEDALRSGEAEECAHEPKHPPFPERPAPRVEEEAFEMPLSSLRSKGSE